MLRIRLTRRGKRNQPVFRIVIAEASRPIKGRFIEILGFYNPRTKEICLKKTRIQYWLSQGAQPSATVHNLLVDNKVIKKPKIKATTQRVGKKKQEPGKKKIENTKEQKPDAKPIEQEEPKKKNEENKQEKNL